jgi:GNAT superfamily N-acetyltransferase
MTLPKKPSTMPRRNHSKESMHELCVRSTHFYVPDEYMELVRLSECPEDAQFHAARLAADAFEEGDADGYLAYFREKYSGKNCVYVLLRTDGSVVGCFSIKYEPGDAFVPCIGDVVVDPQLRTRGFGRRLLDEAADILSRDGWQTAYLWCTQYLQPYYEKLGWKKMTVADGKTGPVFVMSKSLASPWFPACGDDGNYAYVPQ